MKAKYTFEIEEYRKSLGIAPCKYREQELSMVLLPAWKKELEENGQLRIFIPGGRKTEIRVWRWTPKTGLEVEYHDGLKCASGWTLKELVEAGKERGDGLPAVELVELGEQTLRGAEGDKEEEE